MTSLQKKDQSSFGAPEKKERKRIQPQLILSPTKSAAENDAVAARAKQALADLGDLKEQSEIAANLLGPGRKIYVDLPSYQREEKFVDWKELLKERGVKSTRPVAYSNGDEGVNSATNSLESKFGSRNRDGAVMNPLAQVIQKLERSVGVASILEEGEMSESSSIHEQEEEEEEVQDDDENMVDGAAGSDSDGDGEGEGDATDTGVRTDKEGKDKDGDDKKLEDEKNGKRRRGRGNDYDYYDNFIDDTEYIEVLEHTDRRKSKYAGFFIAKGSIDRSDELLPGAAPLKNGRRRRRRADGTREGSQQPSGTMTEGISGDEDGTRGSHGLEDVEGADRQKDPERKRRRRRRKKDSAEENLQPTAQSPKPLASAKEFSMDAFKAAKGAGAAAGAAAAGAAAAARAAATSQPIDSSVGVQVPSKPVQKKETPVYTMPADVAGAIDRILKEARSAPPPPPTMGEDNAKFFRKQLPPNVLEVLKSSMGIFGREYRQHGPTASGRIIEQMYDVLEPYTTRENLRIYAIGGRPRRSSGNGSQSILSSHGKNDVTPPLQQQISTPTHQGQPAGTMMTLTTTLQPQQQNITMSQRPPAYPSLFHHAAGRSMEANRPQTMNSNVISAPLPSSGTPTMGSEHNSANILPHPGIGSGSHHQDESIRKRMSDEEVIAIGVSQGAEEEDINQIITLSKSKYASVLFRVLLLVGKEGASTATVAQKAVDYGFETWDPTSKSIKDGLSKATKDYKSVVARLQRNCYALTCFPGVEDHREDSEISHALANNNQN